MKTNFLHCVQPVRFVFGANRGSPIRPAIGIHTCDQDGRIWHGQGSPVGQLHVFSHHFSHRSRFLPDANRRRSTEYSVLFFAAPSHWPTSLEPIGGNYRCQHQSRHQQFEHPADRQTAFEILPTGDQWKLRLGWPKEDMTPMHMRYTADQDAAGASREPRGKRPALADGDSLLTQHGHHEGRHGRGGGSAPCSAQNRRPVATVCLV
ncbi:hypothetical protein BT67DRAFT_249669 [Trichocladium antarcticum]|uniref:Uncharacterized protein n=1 Tax=Trichocladium antarcticum TaxID=1450529 RepID=A0AAN6Z9X1_9PEZI|nr:hypothetical protein BT67DRAFT_249669 [Trichocladium antarcticum]